MMKGVRHRTVELKGGLNMHIAEKGEGDPVVHFIHGFPDTWYGWRHQMLGIAEKGYHAVAVDLRGFGDTDVPKGVENYTNMHVVGDLVALIDVLGQEQGGKINVPAKFIIGDEDLVYTMLGNKEYIHSGEFKKKVPFVIIMEGAGHFINQEKPQEITNHIYQFIKTV